MVDIFGSFLGTNVDEAKLRVERSQRKDALIELLTPTDPKRVVQRSPDIDAAIDALAAVSPASNAVSKQLEKTWSLLWTTEKEINFFIEQGWSTNITQEIVKDALINTIPFVNDNGSFGVRGRIFRSPDDPSIRTQFVFETATLDWNWLPFSPVSFPPVGQGWFDTVYLDEDFRVDRNSRNDILVCRSIEER